MGKNLRVIGLTVGSRRHQLDMIRAIEANGIKPAIDRAFPPEFRHQESGVHFGKIVVEF